MCYNLRFVTNEKKTFYTGEEDSYLKNSKLNEENKAVYREEWKAIYWEYNEQTIELNFPKGTVVNALCSLDKKYVIVIYDRVGKNKNFPPPYNGVVYNADGSIYKILPSITPEGENIISYDNVLLNKDIYVKDYMKNKFQFQTKIIISAITKEMLLYDVIQDFELNPTTGEMIFVMERRV